MNITTVKLTAYGYLANDVSMVPFDTANLDYQNIQLWILGKTDTWLNLERIFNKETLAHDEWSAIQTYEADKVTNDAEWVTYNAWVYSEGNPTPPTIPANLIKPDGYYTQAEVDLSVIEHDEWQIGYDIWVADTSDVKSPTYKVIEPIIFERPSNLVEPTITPLIALVPNTPEPEFTLTELKNNKKDMLKLDCTAAIEAGFVSNATGTSYTYESTLKDQLNISGAAQANTTLDFTVIDSGNNKIRVSHTASQMQQVFTDGVTEIQQFKTTLYSLYTNVDSANDETSINAVVWS